MSAEIAGQPAASPSAGEQDLQIPKHRFDEVMAELRRTREELTVKDQLYTSERQRALAKDQQPQGPKIASAEDLGLDPATYKAVAQLSQQIAGAMVAQKETQMNAQFGTLFERTEQAQLVATHGPEATKHLADVKRRQEDHFRATGGFLPAETALQLIKSDAKDSEITKLRAQIAAAQGGTVAAPAAPVQQPTRGLPNSAATQALPGGGGGAAAGGAKTFGQGSIEEMEAALEAQFGQGSVL